ncbi:MULTISPECIES: succinylglutamate-semialdehyde dehydrogenase [unclassified Sphingomonas]|mgnify:CR=1 FL=1|uniref:succinylglutamate-semialdehyde dehydrogenase n=1 Tax=Sphingomonas TaxID=13687 RepID=UPI000965DCB1|nr:MULTISPECIES: succinylglutamate-semialdehyde dehydrogenase [unclassified Sphingomonas]MBN8811408.1 succinylglutamate-semialdehyde dehydrogenase [Sphingomonas sp.]OJY49681.1 MAG: succinylglutamate-semialdehyde dehydrogenase [Sphingomonas sp. 67-41]
MFLRSTDPSSGETIWEGRPTSPAECLAAVERARIAFPGWARTPLAERVAIARRFAEILRDEAEDLAILISRETGKLLWDSRGEVAAMIGKVEISIAAQAQRAGLDEAAMPFGRSVLRHRPHGVMAVLGPYNFPGHLPNGHIVPALLAGNCVVFKPSEETPAIGERMAGIWSRAGLPGNVLQVVQGGRETGAALIEADIDGLLFTGSAETGRHFRRAFLDRPSVILALELGGNNPLIAWDGDPEAVATLVVHSAFVTTGQRCSCARRLIVPDNRQGAAIVDAVQALAMRLPVAAWNDGADAFMGPLVSARAAASAGAAFDGLVVQGAAPLLPGGSIPGRGPAFIAPALFDATGIDLPDREIFAPALQVTRVADFSAAVARANATAFGLSAGLISADPALWERFSTEIRAGVVNWNRPTTGAASNRPFGGLGESGNHRPSAFYAADYCAYPMASFEAEAIEAQPVPGL